MFCEGDGGSFEFGNISYDIKRFRFDILKESARLDWIQEQSFSLNGQMQPVFAQIPTHIGLGYAFNIMDADELLNLNRYEKFLKH